VRLPHPRLQNKIVRTLLRSLAPEQHPFFLAYKTDPKPRKSSCSPGSTYSENKVARNGDERDLEDHPEFSLCDRYQGLDEDRKSVLPGVAMLIYMA